MLMKLEFSQQIVKKYWNIDLLKISPVGAELFHVDRQTDMMKLVVTYHNFVNVPNN